VVRHLQADTKLDPDLRDAALRFVQTHGDSPPRLNTDSWNIVKTPGGNGQAYRQALQMVEVANRLMPRNPSNMDTLGIAQYRVGAYADALATLMRCQELRTSPTAKDLAFMAMTNFKLGHTDQARAQLDQLRTLMKGPGRSGDAELKGFQREAEALIGRR
jgi:hypothetical protein